MEKTRKEEKNFLTMLLDLLLGNEEKRKKNHQLKQFSKILVNKGYRYLRRNQIQPEFASLVYSIYEKTAASREVFNHFSKPESLVYAIILSIVPQRIANLFFLIEPNKIRSMAEEMPFEKLNENVTGALAQIKEYFTQAVMEQANKSFSQIVTYQLFCKYDYFMLLKNFNAALVEDDFSRRPEFYNVRALSSNNLLTDLDSAFRYFLNAADWNVLDKFFSSIDKHNTISFDNYTAMYQQISKMEHDEVILFMCKILNKDPDYIIPLPQVDGGRIAAQLNKILGEASATLKEIYNERRRVHINQIASKLFDERIDTSLEHYNLELSAELEKNKIASFTYAEELGCVNTFFGQTFAAMFKKFMDYITIRGKFVIPGFMKDFGESYDRLIEIAKGISKLDLKVAPSSTVGYRIKQALKHSDQEEKFELAHVQHDIHLINAEAGLLMQKMHIAIQEFYDYLDKLFQDCGKRQREVVGNWHDLNDFENLSIHEYLEKLVYKTDCMKQFIDAYMAT